MSDVTSRLLSQMLELVSEKFDMPIKAIALSDPYFTELMMEGLTKAKIIPTSFLFIGRGVRWNGIPIVYSNEPGIQIVTQEAFEATQAINAHMKDMEPGLERSIADIEDRDSKSKKSKPGHMGMFA